ncbi:uncharacterized protein Z518_08631 [Rhinocladiella mackenziei CBS 650.93]|uniref:Rhodopsin domain-containing protein n=1 Tax=Rhinocladiella mackenziei CBS 650.93 TaxID=1442369 RepID=A0A0D2I9W0_9EURO|nr:uncharacterized protein Z518_08631 [Rhinocladiella mackenziei CBS 650.93]KIX02689.1 hypothetical protein Z518_08631 [Rhinocladiella mackenziei CBS 650.93]
MSSFGSASATAIALAVLSGCCVLVRFWVRIAFVKHVGPDDYLIALAWAASVAMAIVTRRVLHNSTLSGSTEDDPSITTLLRQRWSSSITYNLAVLLLKDSLLLQYLRFSVDIGYRRACWALGTVITSYGISALLVGFFSCRPIAYSWKNNVQGGKCIDLMAFWLFNASFNSTADIIVCVLPIPILKALQLPGKQMAILISIFLLGAFVCISSIVRLVSVYTATANDENNPSTALWSAIEVNIGIFCACLPSLRHPITQLTPRILAVRRKFNTYSQPPSNTLINVDPKYPELSVRSLGARCSSPTTEISNGNLVDLSNLSTQTSVDNEISTSDISYPHSRDMDSSNPVYFPPTTATTTPTATTTMVTTSESKKGPSTTDKPLPLPAARPSGPRPHLQIRPHIHTSTSTIPLPVEPLTPLASPRTTSTSVLTTRSTRVRSDIVPWDACPLAQGSTYSYSIHGGPLALEGTSLEHLMSRSAREKARREKERTRRKRREKEREAERQRERERQKQNGQRPKGPRQMTSSKR